MAQLPDTQPIWAEGSQSSGLRSVWNCMLVADLPLKPPGTPGSICAQPLMHVPMGCVRPLSPDHSPGDRGCLARRDTMANDATVVRSCSFRCIARCLRNIDGITQLKIDGSAQPNGNDSAQFAESDRDPDLPSGARWRHRLRDKR